MPLCLTFFTILNNMYIYFNFCIFNKEKMKIPYLLGIKLEKIIINIDGQYYTFINLARK